MMNMDLCQNVDPEIIKNAQSSPPPGGGSCANLTDSCLVLPPQPLNFQGRFMAKYYSAVPTYLASNLQASSVSLRQWGGGGGGADIANSSGRSVTTSSAELKSFPESFCLRVGGLFHGYSLQCYVNGQFLSVLIYTVLYC
jgi:hypothetical protein